MEGEDAFGMWKTRKKYYRNEAGKNNEFLKISGTK